jgi:hypothetical protein
VTQSANRIAWLILGFSALVAAGFAVFLLIPTGGDDTDPARNTAQADASPDGRTTVAQPAVTTPASASLPPRRVERTGTVDHVSGHALSIQTAAHDQQRVLLRTDAGVIRVHTLPGLSAVSAGDTVGVNTGVLVRDAFKPPEDTGRVWRIIIFADTPLPDLSSPCPAVGGRIGTVVAVAPGSLHLQTACGEQLLEVLPSVQVQRRARADITDLAIGQRITVNGELLPDGTVSGALVQILDP